MTDNAAGKGRQTTQQSTIDRNIGDAQISSLMTGGTILLGTELLALAALVLLAVRKHRLLLKAD